MTPCTSLLALLALAPAAAAPWDVFSVLTNGGFEEPTGDEVTQAEELVPYWEISEGVALQDSSMSTTLPAEGEVWARLPGPKAWLQQTSVFGGEGKFELSL